MFSCFKGEDINLLAAYCFVLCRIKNKKNKSVPSCRLESVPCHKNKNRKNWKWEMKGILLLRISLLGIAQRQNNVACLLGKNWKYFFSILPYVVMSIRCHSLQES